MLTGYNLTHMIRQFKHRETTWIDVTSPAKEELATLARDYGLHSLVENELGSPSTRAHADLYDNYIYPFVALFSIPVAAIGAFLALNLSLNHLTLFAQLGLIMLMGLVTKNAILIVDFTNQLKAQGKHFKEEKKTDLSRWVKFDPQLFPIKKFISSNTFGRTKKQTLAIPFDDTILGVGTSMKVAYNEALTKYGKDQLLLGTYPKKSLRIA